MTQHAEVVTFEAGGAQVSIPKDAILKNWLAGVIAATPAPAAVSAPALHIRIPDLQPGERYAGLILGKGDEPSHHLILLPGAVEEMNWEQAKEWAASIGGELPMRREQSLLYANLREEFESAWYWSCEQSERYSDYAWFHYFGNGDQDDYRKNDELRARAVRRLPI